MDCVTVVQEDGTNAHTRHVSKHHQINIKLEMRGKAQRDSPFLVLYAASSIAGLPNDNLPHPYLRKHFSVTVQPTPTKFGVNIVR